MTKKLTLEFCKQEAIKRNYEITNEEYIGNHEYLEFIHLECGFRFPMEWNSFNIRGSECPQCSKNKRGEEKRIGIEFCKTESKKRGYEVLSISYKNNREKLQFLHIECGNIFPMSWDNFTNGNQGCPQCALTNNGLKKRIPFEFCKIKSEELGYVAISETYKKNQKFITFVHEECDNLFEMRWDDFYNGGQRCPRCSIVESHLKQKLNIEYCKLEALKYGYEILEDEYLNNYTNMNFKHLECGSPFPRKWSDFQQGKGCPICSKKSQESYEAVELKNYYSEYFNAVPEYEDCINPKTGQHLPFDIFIPKQYEDSEDVFIEIQGHQHYRFTSLFHKTPEDFKYQQYKDKIKKEYAEQHGIFIEIDIRKKIPIESLIEQINDIIYNGYGN